MELTVSILACGLVLLFLWRSTAALRQELFELRSYKKRAEEVLPRHAATMTRLIDFLNRRNVDERLRKATVRSEAERERLDSAFQNLIFASEAALGRVLSQMERLEQQLTRAATTTSRGEQFEEAALKLNRTAQMLREFMKMPKSSMKACYPQLTFDEARQLYEKKMVEIDPSFAICFAEEAFRRMMRDLPPAPEDVD